jgi:hypothetical protein
LRLAWLARNGHKIQGRHGQGVLIPQSDLAQPSSESEPKSLIETQIRREQSMTT